MSHLPSTGVRPFTFHIFNLRCSHLSLIISIRLDQRIVTLHYQTWRICDICYMRLVHISFCCIFCFDSFLSLHILLRLILIRFVSVSFLTLQGLKTTQPNELKLGRKYRSLQVYQRSYSQVGHIVLTDFTLKIVRQNCPTKSSQVGVRVFTLRQLNCKQETSPNSANQ